MLTVQNLTIDPYQIQTLVLPDGTSLDLTLYFRPMQYGWFITSLIYKPVTSSYGAPSNYAGPFTIQGLRVCVSPNLLYQFQNQIPFGLACYANAGINREPTQQQDFTSGAFSLFILTQAEVKEYAAILAGNTSA